MLKERSTARPQEQEKRQKITSNISTPLILHARVCTIQWNLSLLYPLNNSRNKIFSLYKALKLVSSWCRSKCRMGKKRLWQTANKE